MTTRFCPGCTEEVEDTGGFCLLGHRLALEAPTASLQELREEIDRSFEGSGMEVSVAEGKSLSVEAEGSLGTLEPAAVMAPPRPPVVSEPGREGTARPTRLRRVPPPPPPPRKPSPRAAVYRELESDVEIEADPIAAFAPPPRMDWGPDKVRLKNRKPGLRRHRSREN